mgnify:CR=1 FL=1
MAFREAVFVEALRRGHTSREASSLAQNVLLDYGAIPSIERQTIARHMLFYAFQRQSSMEILKTLMRDGASAQLLAGQIRFIKAQHEEAGTWATEPDYARHRLWVKMGTAYDGIASGHYGLAVPGVEAFNLMANAFFTMADISSVVLKEDRDISTLRLTSAESIRSIMEETHATPLAQLILETVTQPRDRFKKGARVDHQLVIAAKSIGQWSLFQSLFDIGVKGQTRRRAGEPVYEAGEVQYEIKSAGGAMAYRAFTTLLTYSGLIRNIRDYTDTAIKAGVYPEDTVLKRRGDGSFVLYSLSLDTVMPVPSEFNLQVKIAEQIERELSGIVKSTSPIED